MVTRRTSLHPRRLAALSFVVGLGALELHVPIPIHAQVDSSKSSQGPTAQKSAQAASETPAARELFEQHCIKCHGADGTGTPARASLAKIPNFTDASWAAGRSDAQRLASILDGKGTEMPSWRDKISEEQARGLVAHVRSFAPTPGTPKGASPTSTPGTPKGASPASFSERIRGLEDEMHEAQTQYRKLSKASPGGVLSKSSQPPQPEVSRPSGPTPVETPAVGALFGQHCVKCHGADGTGKPARGRMAKIPNFTNASWTAQRSDEQLLVSILDGKEPDMPSWRGKVSEEQARGLLAHVRAFAATPAMPKGASAAGTPAMPKGASAAGTPAMPKGASAASTPAMPKGASAASSNEHDRHLADILYELQGQSRRLEEILHELQRQSRKLPENSPGATPSEPSQPRQPEVSRPSGPTPVETPAVGALFGQHCVKCHGADGTGKPARGRMAKIPNFTNASWTAQRSDEQLLVSILDGKEPDMPSWRGKVSEEQARGLLAHVRAFAATPATPTGAAPASTPAMPKGAAPASTNDRDGRPEKEQEESTPAELAEAKPPSGLFVKLIRWLGKFHPMTVHFPIGLLTFAAVAELLRMAAGKPAFDAISRYCVWFGTLTAVVAGTLGWFLGGLRLTDPSWVLTTHRWLGTSTVACALLVLALSEASRRPDRRRTRICYRVTLFFVAALVSVTGFFGGAVVFGIDHYNWPR